MMMALPLRGRAAAEQPAVSEEYVLRVWDVNEGLPTNHISKIAQTPDGYLWVATGGPGLVRFDGNRFVTLPLESNPGFNGFNERLVHSVFASRDGTLWIGLERGGVARRVKGRFELVIPSRPRPSSVVLISSIVEDASGAIWCSYLSEPKVFRWDHGNLTSFSLGQGIPPGPDNALEAASNGSIWDSSRGGCAVFSLGRFKSLGLDQMNGHLAPAGDGAMWAVNNRQLIRCHEDGSKELVADLPWLEPGVVVNVVYSDREGGLWIGTNSKGLFRFRDGQVVKVPTSHSAITSLFEDREGNLWVGTEGGGLNRLRTTAFSLRQTRHGLRHDSVVSLCEDPEGKLWLVGRDGTPVRAVDSSNRVFSTLPGWERGATMTICPRSAGGVWLGLLGDLVSWRTEQASFRKEGLHANITALQEGPGGDLWISIINDGLVRRSASTGEYETIPPQEGLVQPRALGLDGEGRIWAGTEEGLVFFREKDRFVPVPLPGASPGESIRFIVPEGKETVWIGAFGGGLYRWRRGHVVRLPHDAGLPVEDLRSLLVDDRGDFWFGCGPGLFRVARGGLDAVLDGVRSSVSASAYGRNEGGPTVDFSFGFRGTTARTRDGHLWFATYSGALEINPLKLQKTGPHLPVLIEELQYGQKPVALPGTPSSSSAISASPLVLPPHAGPLQIRYSLPELSAPEQIRFRYRLGESEEDWIEAGTQRTAVFPRLSAGDYRFEVAATDSNGQSLLPTASLVFTIRPAWWETSWFRFGAASVGAAGIALLARWAVKRRMRARIHRLEQEHALERERSRIARDIHDEIGANLTQLSIVSELLEMDASEAYSKHTRAIASIARKTVEALDQIVWAVNPRHDTVASLVGYLGKFARNFLSRAGIRSEIRVPQALPELPLPAQVRHHLFAAVKEAINNAVKHSGATEVRLQVEIAANSLSITVSDNGAGFETEPAGEPLASANGNGLRNMRARLEEIAGSCQIQSRKGAGTRVRFEIALTAGLGSKHQAL